MHDFQASVALALQRSNLLPMASAVQVQAFAWNFERVALPARTTIFNEGDEGTGWYLLLHGTVAIARADAVGTPHVLDEVTAPDSFGEMALIDDAPRMASAETCDDVVLAFLPSPVFNARLAEGDACAVGLLRGMAGVICRRQRQLTSVLSDLLEFEAEDDTPDPVQTAMSTLLRPSLTWH